MENRPQNRAIRRVMVGTDRSKTADHAVRWAAEFADRYGAELVREGVEERLSAARRKAIMLCFARAAALRLQLHLDPGCSFL